MLYSCSRKTFDMKKYIVGLLFAVVVLAVVVAVVVVGWAI